MKLSIITINYNNRDGLRKTIESVVNQTWQDFEYIVIDGGSTDGSVEVIKEFADHIDYWVSEPDNGIYNAMNKGIDHAKGEYCNFMNSGDCFYFHNTLNLIFTPALTSDVICGDTINSDGSTIPHKDTITFKTLFHGAISHQSSFIRTSLLKKYHYDESLRIVADWKFWLQTLINDNCSYLGIGIPVSIYDITGISSTNWEQLLQERKMVIDNMYPERVVQDMIELVEGHTWEDKLYIELKHSKYHKYYYRTIVAFLKLCSIFKRTWISQYPNSL